MPDEFTFLSLFTGIGGLNLFHKFVAILRVKGN